MRKRLVLIKKLLPIFLTFPSICIFLAIRIFIKRKRIMGPEKEYLEPSLKEIQYRKLEFKNYADNELTRIIKYLEEHYSDPRISSSLISRETGISRSHIAELIKNRYGYSLQAVDKSHKNYRSKTTLKNN